MTNLHPLDLSVEANFEVNLLQKCYSCKDLELKLRNAMTGQVCGSYKNRCTVSQISDTCFTGPLQLLSLLTTSGSSWCFTNYLWTHSDKDAANP